MLENCFSDFVCTRGSLTRLEIVVCLCDVSVISVACTEVKLRLSIYDSFYFLSKKSLMQKYRTVAEIKEQEHGTKIFHFCSNTSQ